MTLNYTKSGIFFLENYNEEDDVIVGKDNKIGLFDINNNNEEFNRTIKLEKGSNLNYKLAIFGKSDFRVEIHLEGESSNVEIEVLLFSSNAEKQDGKVKSVLCGNNVYSNTNMINLVGEKGDIKASGDVSIREGIEKVGGFLLQENIYLSEKGNISVVPKLEVASNDVNASHGAKVYKLDANKLFYMMSKGIPFSECKRLIVDGYVIKFLDILEDKNQEEFEKRKQEFLNKIVY